jgi:hypothetical protein
VKEMNESARKFFQMLGIIFAVIILVKFILPLVFSALGIVVGVLLTVLFWAAVVVGTFIILSYILRYFRKSN